jgi:hypothetical protein
MNGAQRVRVLLDFLGGRREVRLRADAVEPVDNERSRDDADGAPAGCGR